VSGSKKRLHDLNLLTFPLDYAAPNEAILQREEYAVTILLQLCYSLLIKFPQNKLFYHVIGGETDLLTNGGGVYR
jgi:hypothetical protein